MRQIEAMIACVAVTGAVLYGPVSREMARLESKAAPIIRAVRMQEPRLPTEPTRMATMQLPTVPAESEQSAIPVVPRRMCAAQARSREREQAGIERELAREHAELARAQAREQMQQVRALVREALDRAHVGRASYTVPLG